MLLRLAPALFVVIWSTGWIVAQAARPHADPLTFLLTRYLLAAAALGVLIWALSRISGRAFPREPKIWAHGLASGVLLHAIYLGGVWWAIDQGLPTPLSGLIAALQPLLTAGLAATLIGERLSAAQWLGLGLGLGGLLLGLAPGLGAIEAPAGVGALLVVNAAAMVAVTFGTLYQKRHLTGADLPSVALLQYLGAAAVTLPAAWLIEDMAIDWNPTSVVVMTWSVLGISLGGIGLLLLLIRHGEVSRAASLIYLIPAAVAIQAWAYFGETLGATQIVGMAIAGLGVYLVNRKPRLRAAPPPMPFQKPAEPSSQTPSSPPSRPSA